MISSDLDYSKYEDVELQKKFKMSFLKNNQNTYLEFEKAIGRGDLKHAYRLAHSIKGNAGQAKIRDLAKIAEEICDYLNGKIPVPEDKMREFKKNLEQAIAELKPLLDEEAAREIPGTLNNEQTFALLKKLRPLLEDNDSECLEFLGDIRSIPGAEELALQIEQYDFGLALKTLDKLEV